MEKSWENLVPKTYSNRITKKPFNRWEKILEGIFEYKNEGKATEMVNVWVNIIDPSPV